MKPAVSINLCCYNSEKYLRETLDSIVGQTYKGWELVIINDGSSDSTESIIHEYINQGYPIIYHYQENKGLGFSRNKAIEMSQGEYIAFIDHDDIWLPEKLEKQIVCFVKSDIAIVYCDAYLFNNRGYEKPQHGRHSPPQGKVFDEMIRKGNFMCMSSVMIRSSIFKLNNYWFDEQFTAIEDTELFIRIARDWGIKYAPFLLCKYRMHEGSTSYQKTSIFRDEVDRMIDKFCVVFPEYKAVYAQIARNQNMRDRAIDQWKCGNNIFARKLLKDIPTFNITSIPLYCAMYLPYSFISRIRWMLFKRMSYNI